MSAAGITPDVARVIIGGRIAADDVVARAEPPRATSLLLSDPLAKELTLHSFAERNVFLRSSASRL